MRRLVFVLIAVVGLLAVADRLAALGAERVVAERIQADSSLGVRPDVTIGGVPFLTQAISGDYDDVTVTVHDLRRGDLTVTTIRAHLSDVAVPLSDVVRQRVNRVRVRHATAQVVLGYDDINALLGRSRGVRVGPAGDGQVHVSATAAAAGTQLEAGADVPVVVQGDTVVIDTGLGVVLRLPLPQLPFGIALKSARATPDGIVVTCTADGLLITA